ncbi:MAG: hypothetical protein ACHQT7_00790 [Candidatus Levyibacteriota bacterium]
MEHSSPVSKIVATATASSWAQAYSAGKLHLCLSLDGETNENVTSLGKDVLEKIQREFFALDEKNLETLKNVVAVVIKTIPPEATLSLVLTTIVEDVLYIIIANSGSVLLKRGEDITVIGNGEKDAVIGFSGKVEPADILLAATSGLLKTISYENLGKAFKNTAPHEIGESLAPFLHEHASGTEAALVWKMIGSKKALPEEELQDAEHPNDTLELEEEPEKKRSLKIPDVSSYARRIKIPTITLGKRQLIIVAAVLLGIALLSSLLFEKIIGQSNIENAAVSSFLTPEKQKYDDAIALMSLNKSLAVDELSQVKTETEAEKNKFPAGSHAAATIDTFLALVNQALGGQASVGNSQIKVFFDATKNSDISNVSVITDKGGQITVAGKTKGGFLKSDGSVDSAFDTGGNVTGITQDDKNAYLLEDSVVLQVARSGGKPSSIIDKQASPISIDTFGGNIYLLSKTDKTIYKYVPASFDKASYFTKDTALANPSSVAIDSSIYVVDNGKIIKFTRGASDSFSYAGKPLSSNAQVYTDTDYTNLYVLDPDKKTATVLSKTGGLVTEVNLKGMKNITSIAADETGKKMYICADNKIYSISF